MAISNQIGFRASPELQKKLQEVAETQGRTLSNLIRYIVQQYLSSFSKVNKRTTEEKHNGKSA